MTDAVDVRAREVREREDRLLVEMTDLAAELARDFAADAKQAKAADDKAEAERCTAAFDRMARSVRLSIALRRRLERAEAREASLRRTEAVDLRKARLRARLRSEIRSGDYGFSDRLELERELDARLSEDALYQSFLARPLDQAIAKLRDRLGLPEDDADPDPPPGRSPIEGEVGRAEWREPEGVAVRCDRPSPQPPQSAEFILGPASGRTRGLTAPPEGDQLETRSLRPAPS